MEKWKLLLHHDNASSSYLIQDFLIKHDIVQLRKPPIQSKALYDFWLFPKLKNRKVNGLMMLKTLNATRKLLAITKVTAFENKWTAERRSLLRKETIWKVILHITPNL